VHFIDCPFEMFVLLQPAKRTAYAGGSDRVFAPVERELVFDIVSSPAVAAQSMAKFPTLSMFSSAFRKISLVILHGEILV
jgi:hypothetical protein